MAVAATAVAAALPPQAMDITRHKTMACPDGELQQPERQLLEIPLKIPLFANSQVCGKSFPGIGFRVTTSLVFTLLQSLVGPGEIALAPVY